MSRKWKLNVKRMAVCAMSAQLLLALFPLDAEANTTKRKAVRYVEEQKISHSNIGPVDHYEKYGFEG